jgi:hypothetical protein
VGEVVVCSARCYQKIRQKHLNDLQQSWMAHEVPGHCSLIMDDLQQAWSHFHPPQSPIHLRQLICSIIHSFVWTSSFSSAELGVGFQIW